MHDGEARGRIGLHSQRSTDPPEPLDLDADEVPLLVNERRRRLRHSASNAILDQVEHLLPLAASLSAGRGEPLADCITEVRPAHHLIECHAWFPAQVSLSVISASSAQSAVQQHGIAKPPAELAFEPGDRIQALRRPGVLVLG